MTTPRAGRPETDDSQFTTLDVPAIGSSRTFVVENRAWTVSEVVDPSTHTNVLIFSSDRVARRVRHYPDSWRDLSNEQLFALSWEK